MQMELHLCTVHASTHKHSDPILGYMICTDWLISSYRGYMICTDWLISSYRGYMICADWLISSYPYDPIHSYIQILFIIPFPTHLPVILIPTSSCPPIHDDYTRSHLFFLFSCTSLVRCSCSITPSTSFSTSSAVEPFAPNSFKWFAIGSNLFVNGFVVVLVVVVVHFVVIVVVGKRTLIQIAIDGKVLGFLWRQNWLRERIYKGRVSSERQKRVPSRETR